MPIKPTSNNLDDHIGYCKELITRLRNGEVIQFNQAVKEKTIYEK